MRPAGAVDGLLLFTVILLGKHPEQIQPGGDPGAERASGRAVQDADPVSADIRFAA